MPGIFFLGGGLTDMDIPADGVAFDSGREGEGVAIT